MVAILSNSSSDNNPDNLLSIRQHHQPQSFLQRIRCFQAFILHCPLPAVFAIIVRKTLNSEEGRVLVEIQFIGASMWLQLLFLQCSNVDNVAPNS